MEDFETTIDLNMDALFLIPTSVMNFRSWIFIKELRGLRHNRIMMICWKNSGPFRRNAERQC